MCNIREKKHVTLKNHKTCNTKPLPSVRDKHISYYHFALCCIFSLLMSTSQFSFSACFTEIIFLSSKLEHLIKLLTTHFEATRDFLRLLFSCNFLVILLEKSLSFEDGTNLPVKAVQFLAS